MLGRVYLRPRYTSVVVLLTAAWACAASARSAAAPGQSAVPPSRSAVPPSLVYPQGEGVRGKEPDIVTYLSGGAATWSVSEAGTQLRIAYGSDGEWPQYAALHLNDSYFRLNYGPTSGWGTSLVLMPALWSEGTYYHGAPVTATWRVAGPDLILSVSGTVAALDVQAELTFYPPQEARCQVRVAAQVSGSVPLDDRPGEAFKPLFLSSMHVSPAEWDTQGAYAGCERYPLPASGWIVPPTPSVTATALGLLGGTSEWKANAPAAQLRLDRPLQAAGWVTPSADPNDDNVGLWAASDRILSSWTYTVTATPAEEVGCTFVPALRREGP